MLSLKSELYTYRRRDHRWFLLTCRIKEKTNYTCEICGINYESKKYIQVHHKYYYEDRNPWDYEDEALQAVCISCHSKIDHSTIPINKNDNIDEMKKYPFVLTKKFISKSSESLKYNKFFNIILYGSIIDCGYLRHNQGGYGRFDYELAYRELILGDPAYSQRKNGEITRFNSLSNLYKHFGNSIFLRV